MFNPSPKLANASIAILVTLKVTMLFFMFHGIKPHPPTVFILGGMGPFLSSAIACLLASAITGPTESWAGRAFALVGLICAVLTFGPQKYFDPAFPLIWPAVLASQVAILLLAAQVIVGVVRDGPKANTPLQGENQCA